MRIKYIILCEEDQSGKTTTLNNLAIKIFENFRYKEARVYGPNLSKEEKLSKKKVNAILERIHFNHLYYFILENNAKVGISTLGDYFDNKTKNSIKSHIEKMLDLGCDFIVCASHVTKGFINGIKNLMGDNFGVFIGKSTSENENYYSLLNNKDRDFILKLLMKSRKMSVNEKNKEKDKDEK